jgi:F0F1-type ATP synthase assembly protein I
MPENVRNAETSMTSLVGGIIDDARHLLKQEVELAKQEFREELTKTKQGAVMLGAGLALASVGGLLLCFMLTYLLNYFVPSIPLWGCFGIVGGVFAVGGGILLLSGVNQLGDVSLVPRRTVHELKETVSWSKTPT